MKQEDYSPYLEDDSKQFTREEFPLVNRTIVAAANKSGDIMLVGARHWDKVMTAQFKALANPPKSSTFDQGFIDQYGQYLSRVDAKRIAIKNGQPLILEDWGDELFSENLY